MTRGQVAGIPTVSSSKLAASGTRYGSADLFYLSQRQFSSVHLLDLKLYCLSPSQYSPTSRDPTLSSRFYHRISGRVKFETFVIKVCLEEAKIHVGCEYASKNSKGVPDQVVNCCIR